MERQMIGMTLLNHKTKTCARQTTQIEGITYKIKESKHRRAGRIARMSVNRRASGVTVWQPRILQWRRGKSGRTWRDEEMKLHKISNTVVKKGRKSWLQQDGCRGSPSQNKTALDLRISWDTITLLMLGVNVSWINIKHNDFFCTKFANVVSHLSLCFLSDRAMEWSDCATRKSTGFVCQKPKTFKKEKIEDTVAEGCPPVSFAAWGQVILVFIVVALEMLQFLEYPSGTYFSTE